MAKIGKTEARDRIEFLKKELERHNRNYYVLNAPTISDFEFDLLMSELQGLERMFPEFATEDSPTRHVGSDLAGKGSDFVQVPHRYPMLSLGNTYAREELYEFDARIRKTADKPYTYSCELKFDGTAICLTYRGGRLLRALTRGDGTQGDDVTRNVVHIPAIPRVLRGEAIPEE
ncbi:MAG: NAD-dependent DNA ligase LigA, partial [Bacteroidales bacterium]|nr:NAD-dependent DNA ligase LigA [Bacteroidales bacterium]